MPAPALASLAKKAGKSYADAERYYKDAKKQVGTDNYALIMGIVKKRLGLKKESAAEYLISKLMEHERPENVRAFFDSGLLNFASMDDVYIDPATDERLDDIAWIVNENDWPHDHPLFDIVNGYEGSISVLYDRVMSLGIQQETVGPIGPRRKTLAQKQGARKAARTRMRKAYTS